MNALKVVSAHAAGGWEGWYLEEDMVIELRRATNGDEPFLEDVFLGSGMEMITAARGYWNEDRERLQFREQLDIASTWIVRYRDMDVGFMMIVEEAKVTELHTLCILPEWQGRGLGSKLVRDLVADASAHDKKLELQVLKSNSRARALYERFGFHVIADLEHHHRMRHG